MNQLIEYQSRAVDAYQRIAGCGESEAARAAAFLVSGYGSLNVHDAKGFTEHLIAVMSDYPADLCIEAAKKIPQTERFLNIAAVVSWLEEKMHERRTAYAEAMEVKRKAEEADRDRAHAEQVAKDKAAFEAWLADHPGGTMRQFLGFTPYVIRSPADTLEADSDAYIMMGPYPSAGHLVGKIMDGVEP